MAKATEEEEEEEEEEDSFLTQLGDEILGTLAVHLDCITDSCSQILAGLETFLDHPSSDSAMDLFVTLELDMEHALSNFSRTMVLLKASEAWSESAETDEPQK